VVRSTWPDLVDARRQGASDTSLGSVSHLLTCRQPDVLGDRQPGGGTARGDHEVAAGEAEPVIGGDRERGDHEVAPARPNR
jgi:hypothetical protein